MYGQTSKLLANRTSFIISLLVPSSVIAPCRVLLLRPCIEGSFRRDREAGQHKDIDFLDDKTIDCDWNHAADSELERGRTLPERTTKLGVKVNTFSVVICVLSFVLFREVPSQLTMGENQRKISILMICIRNFNKKVQWVTVLRRDDCMKR